MQLFGIRVFENHNITARPVKAPHQRSPARSNSGHADVDSWCAIGICTGTTIWRCQRRRI